MSNNTTPREWGRRTLLGMSGAALAGAAGCLGEGDGTPTDPAPGPTPTGNHTSLSTVDTTPSGDATFDIGDDGITITAGGASVYGDADEYAAVYEDDVFSSGWDVTTTIESVEGVPQTGLMVANDLTAAGKGGSAGDVRISYNGKKNKIWMAWDSTGDGLFDSAEGTSEVELPVTIRLRRFTDGDGNPSFVGYFSTDGGDSYEEITSATVPDATETQDAGITVTGQDGTGTVEFSRFDVEDLPGTPTPLREATPVTGEAVSVPDHLLDVVDFGNETSEQNHNIEHYQTGVRRGKGDRFTRILKERSARTSGSLSFTMSCDPEERTHLTLKCWSGEAFTGVLLLFDGQELVSSQWSADGWPALEGGIQHDSNLGDTKKFRYSTYRLPKSMTEDKDEVQVRIIHWWTKGETRGLYRAYTHTDPDFEPPSSEELVSPEGKPPIKSSDESQIQPHIAAMNEKITSNQKGDTTNPKGILGLGMAYNRDWIESLDRDAAFQTIRNTLDKKAIEETKKHPASFYRRGWTVHGRYARGLYLVLDRFREEGILEDQLSDHPDAPITRREAYAQWLRTALEWRAQDRREGVANQILYVTHGLIRMNQALEAIAPEQAPPDDVVDSWIDQALGYEPVRPTLWQSEDFDRPFDEDDIDNAGQASASEASGAWYTFTEKGNTKEPRWAQDYGEQVHQITAMYAETGLERIKERAIDLERARAHFRDMYTAKDGYRTIGVPGAIGARHRFYPYGRAGYSNKPLYQAKVLDIPESNRLAELNVKHGRVRAGGRLPRVIQRVEGYRAFQEREQTDYRLPFERSEPTAWADEDLGVLAVHDGDEHFYAALNYNSSTGIHDWGVNNLARVQHSRPSVDKLAYFDMDSEFNTNGGYWERVANALYGSTNTRGTIEQPISLVPEGEVEVKRAVAGQKVPQTCRPDGTNWPGADGYRGPDWDKPAAAVGMAVRFQQCRYGDYLIGMNATGSDERTFYGSAAEFELEVPSDAPEQGRDLISGEQVDLTTPVMIEPRSSMVIDLSAGEE